MDTLFILHLTPSGSPGLCPLIKSNFIFNMLGPLYYNIYLFTYKDVGYMLKNYKTNIVPAAPFSTRR